MTDTVDFNKDLEELIIEIGASSFVGEHNMVYRPALDHYKNKVIAMFEEYKKLV